jgi:hypothetical protein
MESDASFVAADGVDGYNYTVDGIEQFDFCIIIAKAASREDEGDVYNLNGITLVAFLRGEQPFWLSIFGFSTSIQLILYFPLVFSNIFELLSRTNLPARHFIIMGSISVPCKSFVPLKNSTSTMLAN